MSSSRPTPNTTSRSKPFISSIVSTMALVGRAESLVGKRLNSLNWPQKSNQRAFGSSWSINQVLVDKFRGQKWTVGWITTNHTFQESTLARSYWCATKGDFSLLPFVKLSIWRSWFLAATRFLCCTSRFWFGISEAFNYRKTRVWYPKNQGMIPARPSNFDTTVTFALKVGWSWGLVILKALEELNLAVTFLVPTIRVDRWAIFAWSWNKGMIPWN